ncbi:MAG TPA: site-2 protease family protein [Candidatus Limnocylindrales bacterium]|nr:site-2 protease family protein [Candidatus Limnocylindrales bacterium]
MFVQQHPVEALALIAFFLLLAFPVHEFAHAYAAYRLGDSTAKLFGKLTLNPIAHFDQVGGTMLVLSILLTGFPFGFAQTPVNPRNLRGKYGEVIVAGAGPVSNLIMAAIVAIPLRILISQPDLILSNFALWDRIGTTLVFIVEYSILLGLFNLIPIPPLDGGAIMLSLVSPRTAWQLRPMLAQYGFFLIILLIIPLGGQSILGRVLLPIVNAIYGVLVG